LLKIYNLSGGVKSNEFLMVFKRKDRLMTL